MGPASGVKTRRPFPEGEEAREQVLLAFFANLACLLAASDTPSAA